MKYNKLNSMDDIIRLMHATFSMLRTKLEKDGIMEAAGEVFLETNDADGIILVLDYPYVRFDRCSMDFL